MSAGAGMKKFFAAYYPHTCLMTYCHALFRHLLISTVYGWKSSLLPTTPTPAWWPTLMHYSGTFWLVLATDKKVLFCLLPPHLPDDLLSCTIQAPFVKLSIEDFITNFFFYQISFFAWRIYIHGVNKNSSVPQSKTGLVFLQKFVLHIISWSIFGKELERNTRT